MTINMIEIVERSSPPKEVGAVDILLHQKAHKPQVRKSTARLLTSPADLWRLGADPNNKVLYIPGFHHIPSMLPI